MSDKAAKAAAAAEAEQLRQAKLMDRRFKEVNKQNLTKMDTVDRLMTAWKESLNVTAGTLKLTVYEGRNIVLRGKRGDRHDDINPYCEVFIGENIWKTSTQHDGFPYWNEEFDAEVIDENACTVSIKVFDWRRVGKNHPMGQYTVTLKELLKNKPVDIWVPLASQEGEDVKGELHLKATYVSSVELNNDFTIARENFSALNRILLNPSGAILVSICKVYTGEDICAALVRLAHAGGASSRYLNQLLDEEVRNCQKVQTLFRGDSMCSKSIRNFFQLIATSYLRKTFKEIVTEIIANPTGFEVDPDKIKAGDDMAGNVARLQTMIQRFQLAIVQSLNEWPLEMRQVFSDIRTHVEAHFPGASGKAIGTFFFLRFVCPAIFFPEQYSIIEESLDADTRRPLILICKLLTQLANGVVFTKEEYMMPFNEFITTNLEPTDLFLDILSNIPWSAPPSDYRNPLNQDQLVKLMSVVVRVLNTHLSHIEALVQSGGVPGDREETMRDIATLKEILGKTQPASAAGAADKRKRTNTII